ncbi:MAG: polysaccharide deacetylase family protein [Candidatus Geothermincolia bacterium]
MQNWGTRSSRPNDVSHSAPPLVRSHVVGAVALVMLTTCLLLTTVSLPGAMGAGTTPKQKITKTVYPARCSWVGFDEFLVIKNASTGSGSVTCKYQLVGGKELVERYKVWPWSEITVNVESVTGPQGYESIEVDHGTGVKVARNLNLERLAAAIAAQPSRDQARARVGSVITSGQTSGNKVALTFDTEISDVDPHHSAEATTLILDILRDNGVKATFFVTGKFAEVYPELVIRMAYEGHDVGNHSYDHPDFQKLSPEQINTEVCWCDDVVKGIIGASTKPYFRFPGGKTSDALVKRLGELGYLTLGWTVDTADWTGISSQALVSSVVGNARAGNIYLLHPVFPAQKAAALPTILKELKQRGYQPCSITETLSM